jgi:hypothetical protein
MSAQIIQFGDHLPKALSGHRPSEEEIRGVLYDCWAKDALWYHMAFAHRVRPLRKALRISEQEAADALCVTLKTYRKYETAERVRTNHQGINNFARTFGISLECLIAGEGPVLLR